MPGILAGTVSHGFHYIFKLHTHSDAEASNESPILKRRGR